MYRQNRRGSPTGKSPLALCCTDALSQMSTSFGCHACAYLGACGLGVILQRLQQRATFGLRQPLDVRGAVQIEVQRGLTRDRVRTNDRMRDVDELFEGTLGGHAWRERASVVVGVPGPASEQARLQLGREESERRPHVDEAGVATGPARQFQRVEHGRGRGPLDVRVVGVERLEEAGAEAVAAERNVPELGAELIGEDEPGVDDLAVVAVAQHGAGARPRDRVLHRSDHRRQRAHLRVGSRGRAPHAHHAALRECLAQERTGGGTRRCVGRIEVGDLGRAERFGQDAHRGRRFPSHRTIVGERRPRSLPNLSTG